MATHHEELLIAARRLLARRAGQKGPLPGARIRRSISTTYYALFHFLLDEVGRTVVGTGSLLRGRRRTLVRTLSHRGMKVSLDKVKGQAIDTSIAALFRPEPTQGQPTTPPGFVRTMAEAFSDAQAKRLSADYDLDAKLSGADARRIRARAVRAIEAWELARSPDDRTFKQGLALLMLLGGQLRRAD